MRELPFSFGYSFFARVILPGQLATASFLFLIGPAVQQLWPSLDAADKLAGLISLVLFAGILTWISDSRIYWLYEGISWPRRLRLLATKRLQSRVMAARNQADALKSTDRLGYAVIWDWLRRFPIESDGIPKATRATELGNILAAAESYPKTRYGMTSEFYWYRIWLSIDAQARGTIERNASKLDGTVYLSAILLCTASLYLGTAAFQFVWTLATSERIAFLQGPELLMLLGALAGLACRWMYKLSLDLAREKAEFYAALFDLYRGSIKHMTAEVPQSERDLWDKTWRYLRYQQIECPNCHKYYKAGDEGCPYCSSRP